MLEINLLDVIFVIILLAFMVRGFMRGLAREVGGLLSVICGFALGRHFQPSLEPTIRTLFPDKDIAGLTAFLLIFLLTIIVGSLLISALRKFMSITLTSWIDYILGGFAGAAKALVVLTVLFYMVEGFFPDLVLIENSQLAPLLSSMANYMRAFIPDAFNYKLPISL